MIEHSGESQSPINRLLGPEPLEKLVPKTSVVRFFTEEESRREEQDRAEIERIGAKLAKATEEEALYPGFYDRAIEALEAGMSIDAVRDEMRLLTEDMAKNRDCCEIIIRAYENAIEFKTKS